VRVDEARNGEAVAVVSARLASPGAELERVANPAEDEVDRGRGLTDVAQRIWVRDSFKLGSPVVGP
jgi:hypothetical protein